MVFDDLVHLYFFSDLETGKGLIVSIQYIPLWVIANFRVYRKFNYFKNLDRYFLD